LDNNFSHLVISPPIRFGLVSCGASCRATRALLGKPLFQGASNCFCGHRPCLQVSHAYCLRGQVPLLPQRPLRCIPMASGRLMHLLINFSD
jgi:hypothetical protein